MLNKAGWEMTVLPEHLSYKYLLPWAQNLVSCFQKDKGKTKWQHNKTTVSDKFWFINLIILVHRKGKISLALNFRKNIFIFNSSFSNKPGIKQHMIATLNKK